MLILLGDAGASWKRGPGPGGLLPKRLSFLPSFTEPIPVDALCYLLLLPSLLLSWALSVGVSLGSVFGPRLFLLGGPHGLTLASLVPDAAPGSSTRLLTPGTAEYLICAVDRTVP